MTMKDLKNEGMVVIRKSEESQEWVRVGNGRMNDRMMDKERGHEDVRFIVLMFSYLTTCAGEQS